MAGLVAHPEMAVSSGLTPKDFVDPAYRDAMSVLLLRLTSGEPVTPVTVGMPDLPQPPSAEETGVLARDLWGHSIARRMAKEAAELVEKGIVGDQFLEALSAVLDRAGRGGGTTPPVRDVALRRAAELLMDRSSSRVRTGYPGLDAKLGGGLLRGVPCIIGARTGHGKSAVALGITRNVVMAGGKAIVFSLEDAERQYADRVLAQESGLPANSLEKGGVDLTREAGRLPPGWWLDDSAGLTSRTISRRARLLAHRAGRVDLVVVDYIQLVRSEKDKSPPEAIKDSMADMAKLARDLDCPVLILSQCNRLSEHEDRRPTLSDLKWAGALEEVAKMVLIVHREHFAEPAHDLTIGIHVDKNSFGQAGESITLPWNGPLTKVG